MTLQNSRRNFLKQSAVAVGALGTFAIPRNVHAGANEELKIALIGCGGRGSGAASDALYADPNAKLTVVADVFPEPGKQCLESLRNDEKIASRIAVQPSHVFSGFDAYKQAIDSDVDVVILATPPHFRPAHLAYAVERGKHCFVEKPVAVDVPGLHSIEQSCELARQKGLSVVSGLCYRYAPAVQATIDMIRNGAIGKVIALETVYHSFTLWHRGDNPEWSPMERQVRNWYYYTWLSGDHIVEQAVHGIDAATEVLGDIQPLRAVGIGGRQQRTDAKFGNIFDHHSVSYEFPERVKLFFSCRQQVDTATNSDVLVLGTKGQALLLSNKISGETNWTYKGPKPSMFVAEQEAFLKSIRDGNPINNGHYMCNSTLIGIMGRMCTYTGLDLTWDQVSNSTERLGPEKYEWGPIADVPPAIPGRTKFI